MCSQRIFFIFIVVQPTSESNTSHQPTPEAPLSIQPPKPPELVEVPETQPEAKPSTYSFKSSHHSSSVRHLKVQVNVSSIINKFAISFYDDFSIIFFGTSLASPMDVVRYYLKLTTSAYLRPSEQQRRGKKLSWTKAGGQYVIYMYMYLFTCLILFYIFI